MHLQLPECYELFTQKLFVLIWSLKCVLNVLRNECCAQCKTQCLFHIPPAIYFSQVLQACALFSAVLWIFKYYFLTIKSSFVAIISQNQRGPIFCYCFIILYCYMLKSCPNETEICIVWFRIDMWGVSTSRMFFFVCFINAPFTRISRCFNNAAEPWSEIYLNLWQNSNKSLLDCFKSQRQSLMQTYSIIKSHLELVQVCYTYEIKSLPCIFIDVSVLYLKVRPRSSYNRLSTSKDQQSKEDCI